MNVQLYITRSGRVQAGSLRPTHVAFGDRMCTLNYDAKRRQLSVGGGLVYQQTITQSYHLSASDTHWIAKVQHPTDAVPLELSVVNNDGRVAVFRGRHVGSYAPDKSTRQADLIARVADTAGHVPSDWSCDRVFELRLQPEVEAEAARGGESLALLLAIATEGFWSQGAIVHAGNDRDDTHGGAVDEVALLEQSGRSAPGVIHSAKSLLRGYDRHYRKERARRERAERERGFDSI